MSIFICNFCFLFFSIVVAETPWNFIIFVIFFQFLFMERSYVRWEAGADISTLISISDRLGPSIFRQKIESTRLMRDEINGKVFILRQSWHFSLWCCFVWQYFCLLYPDLACKHLCLRPRKTIKQDKIKYKQTFLLNTDDIKQSIFLFFLR